jgi:uncharacterized phiE125 gp8 family phage protein
MFSDIQVVVHPVKEPCTLDQLKGHARVALDDTSQDADLNRALVASRMRCEGFTRLSLITQTLDVWYHSWDNPGLIEQLPRGKVQQVLGVFVYDDSSIETEVDSGIYTVMGNTILFATWPPYFRPYYGIRVQIVSGFGDEPEDVPADLTEGILEYATHMFEYRLGEGPETKYQAQASTGGLPPTVYDKWNRWQVRYSGTT